MALTIDHLDVLAFPILSGEASTSGVDVPLASPGFSFRPVAPVVELGSDPTWTVRVTRPPAMTVVETITPSADPEVVKTFGESHSEQENELGRFAFSTRSVDALDIEPGDLVEFHDRSICIGGGVIRAKEEQRVGRRVEGKPAVTYAGVRPIGVLEEAAVRPARGLGSTAQDRIWGWFGVTYDDSTWIAANPIATVGSGFWWSFYDVAPDFADRTAQWVFARRRAGDPPMDRWAPGGECLFRQTGTIPAGVTEVEIEWAGDVSAELYFEGESLGVAYYGEGEGNVERKRVAVVAGSEVLVAVACANDDWPEDPVHGPKTHNPGGAIWSVHWINSAGQRGGVVMHSDSSAVMLEYVPSRPGVTPGDVLLEVLAELQALGYITWVTPTFTADLDSNGRPWAEVGEIGTKVGYSFWKLVQQLVAVYIDTDLTPGTNEWHAWSKGTRGASLDVDLTAASEGDPESGALREHTVIETLMLGNVVLSFSKFGWQEHTNWTTGRRIDSTLGLGALPSFAEVQRWADAELEESGTNRVEHDVDIEPPSDALTPYWAYGVGDTVLIAGDPQPIVQIDWHRDESGRIHWRQQELEE